MKQLGKDSNHPMAPYNKRDDGGSLIHQGLEELFEIAQSYGRTMLYQHDNGDKKRFNSTIYFETIGGCKLEATSSHNCKTIKESLMQTIGKAREIVSHFKSY